MGQVIGAASDAVDPYQILETKVGRAVDKVALDALLHQLQAEMLADEPLRPGVQSLLLESKRRGLSLAVASNSPAKWVNEGLALYGIADYFGLVCTPDDGVLPKPAPDLYLLAAERLGVAPSQAIAIEDSPHGASAAIAGGLACVVVPGELTREHTFPPGSLRFESLEGIAIDRLTELARESAHIQPPHKE